MDYQYFKGVFTAFLGTDFMNEPIAEWQIDLIKASCNIGLRLYSSKTFLSPT